jgi:hypothetical protein
LLDVSELMPERVVPINRNDLFITAQSAKGMLA